MPSDNIAHDAEPSSTEYSTIWVAYALQATGALGFVFGPLVALIISYVRSDAADAGFIASHYRWLIRTFWWTLLGYLLSLTLIFAGVWPIVGDIVHEAIRTGGRVQELSIDIPWQQLFTSIGAAMAGGIGIAIVWVWNLYRIVRGAVLLAERSPAP